MYAHKPNKSITFDDYCKNEGVKPIPKNNIVAKKAKPPPNRIYFNKTEYEGQMIESRYSLLDEPLYHDSYCNDGQRHIIKKLQQNKYQIIQVLDLHHYTQQNAILKLESFINGNITPGNTCLKIIHGKGLNSPDGRSVLKSMVRRFLEYHPRLLAYANPGTNNGGDGVTLVKLKN